MKIPKLIIKAFEELFNSAAKGFKVLLILLNSGKSPFILWYIRRKPDNRKWGYYKWRT